MTDACDGKVNALLGRLFQEPGLLQRLRSDREAVFREAGLSPQQCAALREGSPDALARVGADPILRMHYLMASNPEIAGHVTIRDFLDDLRKERRGG